VSHPQRPGGGRISLPQAPGGGQRPPQWPNVSVFFFFCRKHRLRHRDPRLGLADHGFGETQRVYFCSNGSQQREEAVRETEMATVRGGVRRSSPKPRQSREREGVAGDPPPAAWWWPDFSPPGRWGWIAATPVAESVFFFFFFFARNVTGGGRLGWSGWIV
jgi:hypothetical protein